MRNQKTMITRTFHPVGQGAFYTEEHHDINFRIVYDCGNIRKARKFATRINSTFKPNTEIDILFISHFDYDHVSYIPNLKNRYNIKNVILPLLSPTESKILSNVYQLLKEKNISTLIENPKLFFGEDTNIIYVNNNSSEEETIIPIESIKEDIIKSGTKININTWSFIPYNFEFQSRKLALEKKLKQHNLDILKIESDLNYVIEKRKQLKIVYNSLAGGINQNSMLVYSGPTSSNNYLKIIYYANFESCKGSHYFNLKNHSKVGCVYTGDSDLNKIDISNIFRTYKNMIGTVQIPHHGDFHSFDQKQFVTKEYNCPISFGTNNKYDHPSPKVISNLKNSMNNVIYVDDANIFVEYIIDKSKI